MTTDLLYGLRALLGTDRVLVGEDLAERYSHIWRMDEPLIAQAYLLPKSTAEVSSIMKLCYSHQQPVIVFGGLTNLVGSTESSGQEIIISMEKLNQIEEIDVMSRTITVQSGVLLEQIQNQAKAEDMLFPLNFGAKGSAQIGGIISTNAGGLRVFKYGMTRQMVLGLEVVLADGTIISSMKKIIKDNSAYDLKQLFIGSEGTLGIITRAILKLVEAPRSRNSAFIGVSEYPKVVNLLKLLDSGLAGNLSGFELIWNHTYRGFTNTNSGVKAPLPYDYPYYVLVETLGSNQEQDRAALTDLLEDALQKDIIEDATLAHSEADIDWFFQLREDVHVLKSLCKHDQHFDISLPIPLIGEVINSIMEEAEQVECIEECFPFGHVADGNIHFIFGKTHQSPEIIKQINDIVYGKLKAIGGSVSAEHGIGRHKKPYLSLCRSDEEIALMKVLKNSMDPFTLLNPGNIF